MRPAVAPAFYTEMTLLEGWTNWIYFDTHRPPLATTGIGNMIDSSSGITVFGQTLPWRTKAGNYVTEAQVREEYRSQKDDVPIDTWRKGGMAYKQYAELFLDADVVRWLFEQTTAGFEKTVKSYFPKWDIWPADAQLAVMSGAWNMGPKFPENWPTLTANLNAGRWYDAAYGYQINAQPSERNRRNRTYLLQCYQSSTVALSRNPETLQGVPAVVSSKVAWAAANPAKVSLDAWWAQVMLAELGFYKTLLDGLFGAMSYAALTKFCQSKSINSGISMASLTALSKASSLRLPVTV